MDGNRLAGAWLNTLDFTRTMDNLYVGGADVFGKCCMAISSNEASRSGIIIQVESCVMNGGIVTEANAFLMRERHKEKTSCLQVPHLPPAVPNSNLLFCSGPIEAGSKSGVKVHFVLLLIR